MRYFSYNEPDPTHGRIVTVNENDILRDYYPKWHERKCDTYGREHADATYCFEDCIWDWMILHHAWEVTA